MAPVASPDTCRRYLGHTTVLIAEILHTCLRQYPCRRGIKNKKKILNAVTAVSGEKRKKKGVLRVIRSVLIFFFACGLQDIRQGADRARGGR